MQDISNQAYREEILKEILGKENQLRKAQSFRNSEIYNKRAGPYIEAKLKEEFPESYKSMRKVTSINPAKRITDKKASIYIHEPDRDFTLEGGKELSQDQLKFVEATYEAGQYNAQLLLANRVKKFQQHAQIQVLPLRGVIFPRVLQPHQYDVIPMDSDPETAFAYITSVYDKSQSIKSGDSRDQAIADANDSSQDELRKMRLVWWTADHNMITNGLGEIVQDDPSDIENPIKVLPFIDVPEQKEGEFFVRTGSAACDFTIDLGVVLSDTANINRLQGYAQLVFISREAPSEQRYGPEAAIHLKLGQEGDPTPDVKFINANPDLESSLNLIKTMISLFLTSDNQDPKTVNADSNAQVFTSGLDRFLAQIEAFEASKEDFNQFRWVEQEIFKLIKAWANHYAGADNSPLVNVPALKLPDDAKVTVQFVQPEIASSKAEQDANEFLLVEKGVSSLVEAVMNIFGIDEGQAIEKLRKVQEHKALLAAEGQTDPATEAQAQAQDQANFAGDQAPAAAVIN